MPSPNYSENTQQRITDMRIGIRVDRATAVLTNATVPIFYIHGGNVILTGFYGEIMVALDAAAVISLNCDVDTGTDTPIASNSADGDTYIAGRMLYLPAVAGAATWTTDAGACPISVGPTYVLRPGHIDMTCGADHTAGSMRWSMWYVPLDDAAYVAIT